MEKKLNAATFVYAFNWLVVCLCCWATYTETKSRMATLPDLFAWKPLPVLTEIFFHNIWILWLIPLLWGVATIATAFSKRSTTTILLHAFSSTLLGVLTYFMYALGALLPHIPIYGLNGLK